MEWFNKYLVLLQDTLVSLGVPEEHGPLAALGLIYILLTLVLLLIILRIVRRSRSRGPVEVEPEPSRRDTAENGEPFVQEDTGEASAAETAVAEPAAADVGETELPEEAAAPPVSAPVEVFPPVEVVEEKAAPVSMFDRLRQGLNKTRDSLLGRVDALLGSHARLDDEFIEEFEEILITADFGMAATQELVKALTEKVGSSQVEGAEALRGILADEIRARLKPVSAAAVVPAAAPLVIMVVGVNGVGKTTTIGKLARQFANEGKKVVLGAGDTFRAAAAQQLQVWGERAGATVITHAEGSDPSAVAFDAARAAVARKADVLILDTAGRLHTKVNLMEELRKMRRVLDREIPGAPHETLLVLDATTGQNALVQARSFLEAVEVSGVALTKLDGTAKGGIVVAISSQLQLPIRYIGVGEGVDDLRPFNADEFVDALFRQG